MPLMCTICKSYYGLTLRLIVLHIRNEHNGHIRISCNVDGCPQIYTKSNSYYRHVLRNHSDRLESSTESPVSQITQDIENDQQGIDEEEMDTSDHVDLQLQRTRENNSGYDDDHGEIIEEDESHEVGIRDFSEKNMSVNFIMNLKEFHGVRETSAHAVVTGVDTFVRKTVEILQQRVRSILEQSGIEADLIPELQQQFDEFELPFDRIQTKYEREKYIKDNYFYVAPEEIVLGEQLRYISRRKQRVLDVVEDKFLYIPLCKSIEQFLQNKDIFRLVFSNKARQFDNSFYCDVSDGSIFQQHPMFSVNEHAMKILLYFDDIEICNPLGKKAGVHKLGVFYYSLVNVPVHYRSRLPLIRLVAIVKRKHLKKYGMNLVLQRINDDLIALEEGVLMHLNGRQYNIKGAVLGFCGDTLASHEFSGFKEGVGFAYQKCRHCECTFGDMQVYFHEKDFILRSLDRYDQQVAEIEMAPTVGMRNRLSVAYGITRRSTARDFPHFDLTKMIPEDIMHVLFEGVIIYETKLILQKLFDDGLCTIKQLNNVIDTFPYGYKHSECKPNPIPEKLFESDDTMTLKQSSSSMIVFFRLLPIFLVKQLHVESGNQYVQFLAELCEIVQIVLAPIISDETIQMLKVLIPSHLRKFKDLFSNQNIIPKQHYMGHLPYIIEKMGPLTRVWCMRFESKHQFLKERAGNSKNYKNLEKSLAVRSAMYECALNVSEKHLLFHNDLIVGKSSVPTNIAEVKQMVNSFFGTEVNCIKHLHNVSWIIINGQKFIPLKCEVAFGQSEGLLEFGNLCNILITQEESNEIIQQNVYFELEMYETICFDETVQSHVVELCRQAHTRELVKTSSIFVPVPLHAYKLDNSLYIPVTYDTTDVVKYRKQSVYR